MNRQVARTNRLFRGALLALLDEKPYSEITVSEIAQRSGLARSTFYIRFETKEDLLASFVDDILDDFFDILASRDYDHPDENQDIEINISIFRLWQASDEITRLVNTTDIDHWIMRRLTSVWQRNYDEKIAIQRPDSDKALSAYLNRYLAGAYFGILRHWIDRGMQEPPELMGRLLYALTGPPSLEKVIMEMHEPFSTRN